MPTCSTSFYCVANTGLQPYEGNYDNQPGTYNDNSYFYNSSNGGYYIYFTGQYWCLSNSLGGIPCILRGPYPCSSNCPNLCDDYVLGDDCPPIDPDPSNPCNIFDFDAIFDCEFFPTPTPTMTPTKTPTPTPSPSAGAPSPCSLDANVNILIYTPSVTKTPTMTPSSSSQISLDCSFSGNVTYTTINSVLDCPYSMQFQDCYNGNQYYSSVALNRPDGGNWSQFMIYQSVVNNELKCISYVGVNLNVIGNDNIILTSNLIGYSNQGNCSLCISTLSDCNVDTNPNGCFMTYSSCTSPNNFISFRPVGPYWSYDINNVDILKVGQNDINSLYRGCWSKVYVGDSPYVPNLNPQPYIQFLGNFPFTDVNVNCSNCNNCKNNSC